MQMLINSKTQHCKHEKGCLYAAIVQTLHQLKYGFIMSGIIQLIKSLKALLKGIEHLKGSFTKDSLIIAIFLCSSTFVLRTVKCFLRWLRNKDDGINSFIAGAASGYIGTLLLNKQYCYMLLMFVSSRIVGAIYQYLVNQKWLNAKNSKIHFYLMFWYANFVNSTGYFLEPDILKPDMYNLYDRMACLTPSQKKWHKSSLVYTMNVIKQKKYLILDDYLQKTIDNYKV